MERMIAWSFIAIACLGIICSPAHATPVRLTSGIATADPFYDLFAPSNCDQADTWLAPGEIDLHRTQERLAISSTICQRELAVTYPSETISPQDGLSEAGASMVVAQEIGFTEVFTQQESQNNRASLFSELGQSHAAWAEDGSLHGDDAQEEAESAKYEAALKPSVQRLNYYETALIFAAVGGGVQ